MKPTSESRLRRGSPRRLRRGRLIRYTARIIRPARDDDLQGLQDVERAAGAPFREFGMGEVADDTPPTVAELAAFARDGRAWVDTDHADKPVAYLLVEAVDGDAHIEQVSVHPDYAHRRMGKSLMDVAAAWAQQHGMVASTLRTYAEVPWNGPCYQRLGFRVVPANELGADLRAVRRAETTRGLDRWPCVVMRRPLTTREGPRPAGWLHLVGSVESPEQLQQAVERDSGRVPGHTDLHPLPQLSSARH